MAPEAERDSVAAVVKGCTGGLEFVQASTKVVEAARVVMDLEREVAHGAAPVKIGGWQIPGGRKSKTVAGVTQLGGPLDVGRRGKLQKAVSKV